MKKFILLCSAVFILIPSFASANPIIPGKPMPKPRPYWSDKDKLQPSKVPSDKYLECQKNLDSLIQQNKGIADNNGKEIFEITKSKPKSLAECQLMLDAQKQWNEMVITYKEKMKEKSKEDEDALNECRPALQAQYDETAKLNSEIAQKIANEQKYQEELKAAKQEAQAAIKSAEEAQNRFYIALGTAILAILAAIGLGFFGKKSKQ